MNSPASIEWKKGIDFAGVESIGARSLQEDYSLFRIFKNQLGLVIVLSDGMGGHTSGEIASKNAVNAFDKTFHSYPSESTALKLGASLSEANSQLTKLISSNPLLDGMGCTLIGAFIDKEGIHWISVGDSLLFLYRNNKLIRLNADHSMAPLIEESLRSGKITKEEAINYPNKNALRSAVMGKDLPLIDAPAFPKKLFKDDIIIAASDGILSLSESQIETYLSKFFNESSESIASNLLNAVELQKKPHQDNTTIQVVKIPSSFNAGPVGSKLNILLTSFIILFVSVLVTIFLSNTTFLTLIGFNSKKELNSVVAPVSIPSSDSQASEPVKPLEAKPALPEPSQKSSPPDGLAGEKGIDPKSSKSKQDKKIDIKPKVSEPKKINSENIPDKAGLGALQKESTADLNLKEKSALNLDDGKAKPTPTEIKSAKPNLDVKDKLDLNANPKNASAPITDKSTPIAPTKSNQE